MFSKVDLDARRTDTPASRPEHASLSGLAFSRPFGSWQRFLLFGEAGVGWEGHTHSAGIDGKDRGTQHRATSFSGNQSSAAVTPEMMRTRLNSLLKDARHTSCLECEERRKWLRSEQALHEHIQSQGN